MSSQGVHKSFTVRSNGGLLPRLLTPCLISEAWDSSGPIAKPVAIEYQALWDTGANRSSITAEVVSSLGLINTTYTDVEHAGGITPNVPVYLVNITLLNRVEIVGVEVTSLQLPSGISNYLKTVVGADGGTRSERTPTG